MELVQVYDRPMKINLTYPIVPTWQKIINNRLEQLSSEFQEKKRKCETSFDNFLARYNLLEEIPAEPIEFINFQIENFEDIYYPFFAEAVCKIAVGIRYENPIISYMQEKLVSHLPPDLKKIVFEGMEKLRSHLKNINIQAIFNSEIVKELINSLEFSILSDELKNLNLNFKSIEVHITEESFSNFSLTDNELIQPSFDPTNKLMGSYLSRNDNIYQIFDKKFVEIFRQGIPVNQYIANRTDLKFHSLSEMQSFVLCLI
jgi:hypothetical protein